MDCQGSKVAFHRFSRSGVLLEYTPEDTLKSLIMERHLASEKNLDGHNAKTFDDNLTTPRLSRSSEKVTKITGESEIHDRKPPVSIKRPFLRKNQGRAAWCSRLYQKEGNIADIPKAPVRVVSCPNNLSLESTPARMRPLDFEKVNLEKSQGSSQDDFFSAIASRQNCNIPVYNDSSVMGNNEHHRYIGSESFFAHSGANSNTDDNELEEFEMLERLTASPHCATFNPVKSTQDTAQQPLLQNNCYLSSGKSDVKFSDVLENSPSSGSHLNESVNSTTSNGNNAIFGGLRKSINGFTDLTTAKPRESNRLPTIESVSREYNDSEAWAFEMSSNIATEPKNTEGRMCPSLSSVRFNLPEEPHETQNGNVNVKSMSSVSESSNSSTSAIKAWITRLEAEVSRFNAENATLQRMKTEREEALKILEKDRKEFDKYKESTVKAFEAFRQDELAKIKKERKVLMDYQKSLHLMPQKRDRKEIERLKQQLSDEKNEAAQRELRLQHQLNRQRVRIEELTVEKAELLERIKRLEQTRLTLQNNLAEAHANHVLQGSSKLHRNQFKSQNLVNSISRAVTFGSFKSTLKEAVPAADTASADLKRSISVCADSQATNLLRNTSENLSKSLPLRIPPTKGDSTSHTSPQASEELLASPGDITNGNMNSDPANGIANAILNRNQRPTIREIRHPDYSMEKLYCDGSRVNEYSNGSRKEIAADGASSVVYLFNGDTKQTLANGTVYAIDGALQTTNPDGAEEILYKDGSKELYLKSVSSEPGFPLSQSQKVPSSTNNLSTIPPDTPRQSVERSTNQPVVVEESSLPDGMVVKLFSNGDKIIGLPNGQREVHCTEFKRRIYPDGTVKTVFTDGRQETRYASGRIRVKDRDGRLLLDTRMAPLSQAAVSGLATLSMPPHLIT